LDEMVHVAREMKRRGMAQPLLIGGATTSRQHTAVKIAPEYDGATVHVLDASRAVSTVSALLDPKRAAGFVAEARTEHEQLRRLHANKRAKPLTPFATACERGARLRFDEGTVARPRFSGLRVEMDLALDEVARYVDWTFFFTAWELVGKFPAILDDPRHGAAARDLYANGRELMGRIVREKRFVARAAYGIWPAERQGEDVVLFADDARATEVARFFMLRQQQEKADGEPYRSLADFVAPRGQGPGDWVGAFVVTAGIGAEPLATAFEKDLDDYHAIMTKALADRLAEAAAELLHERVRREWTSPGEVLSHADLLAETYRGIRPAFGYPASPDHSEKHALFRLVRADTIGVSLTESGAMLPTASVAGLYFGHPEARYFAVGRLGRDQVEDCARRKGLPVAEVERWLAPNLGYDPER
ncbi:MAG: methionine synthase, partial [Polyangiaceae bacterium]|nr:methionine synthase [Polyangiaceae bacterium]